MSSFLSPVLILTFPFFPSPFLPDKGSAGQQLLQVVCPGSQESVAEQISSIDDPSEG